MASYKHIESCIGDYIAGHYADVVEVGVGNNPGAAITIHAAASRPRTDIRPRGPPPGDTLLIDDVFEPRHEVYADLT